MTEETGFTWNQYIGGIFNILNAIGDAKNIPDPTITPEGHLNRAVFNTIYPDPQNPGAAWEPYPDPNVAPPWFKELARLGQLSFALWDIYSIYANDDIPSTAKENVALMSFLHNMFGFPLPADVAGLYVDALNIVSQQTELMETLVHKHPDAFPSDGNGGAKWPDPGDFDTPTAPNIPQKPQDYDDWVDDAKKPKVEDQHENPNTEGSDLVDAAKPGLESSEDASSPLIFDLGSIGIEMIDVDSSNYIFWDVDEDGFAEKSGWVGSEDGLLTIDLNSDGIINDHSELFGSTTQDGFSILSNYDTNSDDVINSNDTQFNDLLMWIDANSNAYTDTGELHTLSSLGITEIDLAASSVNYYIAGNLVTHESSFTINGQTRTVIDAWFTFQNAYSYNTDTTYDISIEALLLPNLKGFGSISYLHEAMSVDSTLLGMVQEIATADRGDLLTETFDLFGKVESILLRWANVDGLDPTSRGANIDARKLEFLEELIGVDWEQSGSPNPGPGAAEILIDTFDRVVGTTIGHLLTQLDVTNVVSDNAFFNIYEGRVEDAISPDYVRYIKDLSSIFDGSYENDFYIVNSGFSSISIKDYGGLDKILFDASFTEDDVRFWKDGNDLDIYIGTNVITLDDQFRSGYEYKIELATFAEGYHIDLLSNLTFTGTSGSDTSYGTEGDDTIIGAEGDDNLYGDEGNDTYVFGPGYGNDRIQDYGGENDRLLFEEGIAENDLRFWKAGNDLYVYLGTNRIILDDHLRAGYDYEIETAELSDGTIIDLMNNLTFTGTSGNDEVYGTDSNNLIVGAEGDDELYGDEGDDTYFYSVGDGNDRIRDYGGTSDKILFDTGIAENDLRFWKAGNDLYVYVGSERIILDDHFSSSGSYKIEAIEFSGGSTLSLLNNVTFKGTSAAEDVYGSSTDDIIYGLSGNDDIFANDGDDIIFGGDGRDRLYGQSGSDTFVFEAASAFNDLDIIEDFDLTEQDAIDLSDLLSLHYDPLSDAITDFVEITTSGSDSIVKVDVDGGADNFVQVAKIDGVTGLTDEDALEASGNLIVV